MLATDPGFRVPSNFNLRHHSSAELTLVQPANRCRWCLCLAFFVYRMINKGYLFNIIVDMAHW